MERTIYQRDPLFSDFVSSLPLPESGSGSVYNRQNLTSLKDQFQHMIQDNWDRKQLNDPTVCHDMALKASGWSNYLTMREDKASNILGRKHSSIMKPSTTFHMPRITVYHRSTFK